MIDQIYSIGAMQDISQFYHLLTNNELVVSASVRTRTLDDACIASPDSRFNKRINRTGIVGNFCLIKPDHEDSSGRLALVAYVKGL